jgi:hypothetical protein
LSRRIVELAGAEIFSRTMLVHAATTDVICAYSDAVQDAGAEPTAAAAEVVALTTATEDAFGDADDELVTLTAADAEVLDVVELVAFTTAAEEDETFAMDELAATASEVLATLTEVCSVVATLKQLHALLNFLGFIEQYVAKAGRPVVAVEEAVV